jgi:hypothetical protein
MPTPPTPAPTLPDLPPSSRRWRIGCALSIAAAFASTFILIGLADPHGWQPLAPGRGKIRWVATQSDEKGGKIEPPLTPDWIRDLRRRGVPWPTDLPMEPTGAQVAVPSDGTKHCIAWYLIESKQPSQELWHLDKPSVKVTDAKGDLVPSPSGSGAILLDEQRHLQYLYVAVPCEHTGTGTRLRTRLIRSRSEITDLLRLRF